MNTSLKLMALGLTLTLAGRLAAAASVAVPRAPLTQIAVSYGDLDLQRAEGAAHLYARIKAAAEKVCGPQGQELGQQVKRNACLEQAIGRAVADVAAPALSHYYEAKTGKPVPAPVLARKS